MVPVFYTVVFALGILSMGFQLLASRLLNPHFGSSIIVWAWLISTFLAAFSVGSLTGGWISNFPFERRYRWQIGMGFIVVTTLAATAAAGRAILDRVELRFENLQFALFVSCALLFFPPIAALSAFGPHCVQWLGQRGAAAGKASGLVYGVSTLGNIAGVMFTAFGLIPNFGVSVLLWTWLCVAAASLVVLLLLLRGERR